MGVKFCALFVIILFADVYCKVPKAPTESMGQEVIEMASPDKELPADLEEEPSAESFESKSTSTTIAAATKNQPAKSNAARRMNAAKDEESRIEKELAELYKDPDYKDSGEVNKTEARKSAKVEKKMQKSELRFQPDDYSEVGIAKFRTKTDKVVCTTDKQTSSKTLGRVEAKKRIMIINPSVLFKPKSYDRDDLEKFKTSIDEVVCDQLEVTTALPVSKAARMLCSLLIIWTTTLIL